MLRNFLFCVWIAGLALPSDGAAKPHAIAFGAWTPVKWFVGESESHAVDLKVRPLFVDGRAKEFTVGAPHEVTDQLFVVRRAFRFNDALPAENGAARWRWQRGGWLLVNRLTGRVSQIDLPGFDAYFSSANWYRDYVAYCGVSDDEKKAFATVAQLGRRKPLLKHPLGHGPASDLPDSVCAAPAWQRQPTRVTFTVGDDEKSYEVHGHVVDIVNDEEEEAAQ